MSAAPSREPGVTVMVRDRSDAVAVIELWADFAADGRLDPLADRRRPSAADEAEIERRSWRPWNWHPVANGKSEPLRKGWDPS